jgi:hypothetical protein
MIFVFGFATLVACDSKSAPTCEDALTAAAKKVPKLADPGRRSEIVAACIKDQWPDEYRTCIAKAIDEPDLEACVKRYTQKTKQFSVSKVDVAKSTVRKYAYEAFLQWGQAHPSKACPDKLDDLNEYMNDNKSTDPWGQNYKMMCGPNVPAGAKGIGIMSFGEDQKEGTADDIKSWD